MSVLLRMLVSLCMRPVGTRAGVVSVSQAAGQESCLTFLRSYLLILVFESRPELTKQIRYVGQRVPGSSCFHPAFVNMASGDQTQVLVP